MSVEGRGARDGGIGGRRAEESDRRGVEGERTDPMTTAAVCGLFCRACSLYIASTEEPGRLKALSGRMGLTEEELLCLGCRSDRRYLRCRDCGFVACAAGRGVEFCSLCEDYPCAELRAFQAERPHRADLWADLERIREVGGEAWAKEAEARYACPACGAVNSAYDPACRACGHDPSCDYVARHGEKVRRYLRGA